jgi:hypothetical protein
MTTAVEEAGGRLREIKTFPSLMKYLRDELDWPIDSDDFEDIAFDWQAEELGIDPDNAANIQEIKQLRPLISEQPWGIFFIKFEPRKLPVVALRRILCALVIHKRTSVKSDLRDEEWVILEPLLEPKQKGRAAQAFAAGYLQRHSIRATDRMPMAHVAVGLSTMAGGLHDVLALAPARSMGADHV